MNGFTTRLPLIAAIGVAILMVLSLLWQGWRFDVAEQYRQSGLAANDSPASSQSAVTRTDKALASVNLFGNPTVQDQQQKLTTENLPETNLRLILRGVMSGDKNSTASALIEDSSKKTDAYLIDDELPGNATLKSVFPHRIVIERSGALENLYFPERKEDKRIQVTESSQSQPASQQPQPVNRQPPTSSARQEAIRNRLEELRNRLRNNSN